MSGGYSDGKFGTASFKADGAAMLRRMQYADTKLGSAVEYMATSTGDIRKRLALARDEFGPVSAEDVPPFLRKRYVTMRTRLDAYRDDRGVPTSASDVECARLARELFDLAFDLRREIAARREHPNGHETDEGWRWSSDDASEVL